MPAFKDFLGNSQPDDNFDRCREDFADALGTDATSETRPRVAGIRIAAKHVQVRILHAVDPHVPELPGAVRDQDADLTGVGCRIESR